MLDAIRSEWIKLTTLTVNKVLVAIAVAFPIAVTTLVAGFSRGFWDSADVADLIGFLGWLSALLFGVVATIGMAGEFHHSTIRPTFAAEPVRITPLLAKLIVQVVVTAMLVITIVAVAWLIATTLLDGSFSLSAERFRTDLVDSRTSTPQVALAGTVLLAVGVAIVGFGVGNLVRNSAAAVTCLLLWPLVIENILARVLFSALDLGWARYLPFTQGLTLGFADRDGDPDELMSRVGAGVYFYAFVTGVTVLGLIRTHRSDA